MTGALLILRDAALLFVAIVIVVRLVGLRAFTKMSGFDFALTVAIGSVLGSAILTEGVSPLRAAGVIAAIFAIQVMAAWLRQRFAIVRGILDNEPLLLMKGPEILDENLARARITRADLMAKLREANVLDFSEVRAVVLETTGDVSVLHGPADGRALAPPLIEGVRRGQRSGDA